MSTKSSPALRTQTRVEDCPSADAPDVGSTTKTFVYDKSRRKPLKLEKYDGVTTSLETFLAKYYNCKRYNEWSDEESVVFLRDSLTGNASQVLWEISDETGHDEIVRLLRNRFGNSNQTERYRAELHARRRKRGESVQAVYQDICRLMALGFPGHSGELFEVIARDAFLNSLGDSAFRIRVLDQQPKTLDDVLAAVVRMEAYSDGPVADDDNFEKKMVRVVSPARESDADKRLRELEEHVERQNQEIRQLRESANRRSPSPYPRHKGEFPDNFAGGYNGGHRGDQRPPGGQSCFNPNFAAPNASGLASCEPVHRWHTVGWTAARYNGWYVTRQRHRPTAVKQ